jgi:hypothetical protein
VNIAIPIGTRTTISASITPKITKPTVVPLTWRSWRLRLAADA